MKTKETSVPSPVATMEKGNKPAKSRAAHAGVLTYKSANSWIDESKKRPDPKKYFNDLIVQFENTVIFAATNVGKSILATQVCEDIAKTEKVLYLDLELSAKQFQKRYTNPETGQVHVFPDNFMRAEVEPENLVKADLSNEILNSIEEAAMQGTKFFVIDNLTCICNDTERGKKAGDFMHRLILLKKKYGITTVVIAHTPKRRGWKPLTQFDLAGSSKLINLFDAGIAMACSAKDNSLRYLKQVKVRTGEFQYDGDNVLLMEMNTDCGYVKFDVIGVDCELDHLNALGDENSVDDDIITILKMKNSGMTVRAIAEALNLSKSKVDRLIQNAKRSNITIPEGFETNVTGVPNGTMRHTSTSVQTEYAA